MTKPPYPRFPAAGQLTETGLGHYAALCADATCGGHVYVRALSPNGAAAQLQLLGWRDPDGRWYCRGHVSPSGDCQRAPRPGERE